MVAVPVSAFEVYQQAKQAKKKSARRKNKKQESKLKSAVVETLKDADKSLKKDGETSTELSVTLNPHLQGKLPKVSKIDLAKIVKNPQNEAANKSSISKKPKNKMIETEENCESQAMDYEEKTEEADHPEILSSPKKSKKKKKAKIQEEKNSANLENIKRQNPKANVQEDRNGSNLENFQQQKKKSPKVNVQEDKNGANLENFKQPKKKSPKANVQEDEKGFNLENFKQQKQKSPMVNCQEENDGSNLENFKQLKQKSPNSVTFTSLSESSVAIAEKYFSWMVNPIDRDTFFGSYWEKRPVHISREMERNYFSGILSTSAIDSMLRKNNIMYGKNIDITVYENGQRKTFNAAGRAHAAVVWDYYRNGCSVRLLNPQTYHSELRELNTRLQEVFGSFVGANAYLTPPNSQGFAPHYDDIEAFILQVEGRKAWRVYSPRDSSEKLPRTSSPNFTQDEIGEPILEVLLEPGDLLYFPRGFIHQASTVPGHHSLHVTVSTYQRNSWADLLEKLVPAALTNAIEEDETFRRGMPLDVLKHIGAVHSESESPEREAIFRKLKKFFSKLFEFAPVDAAADQIAKEYIHDALPPSLSSAEKKCSVLENGERMGCNGKLLGGEPLLADTRIRLARSNVLRLVSEEDPDTMKIYHSMENSLEYHGEEPQCIEIRLALAPAVEHLIHSYPSYVSISDLPSDEDSDKIEIASELWEHGLILTEHPLPISR